MAVTKTELQTLSVDLLDFDLHNPRFADATYLVGHDERAIIRFYLEDVDLRELLDSISASGYIDFDPMLVIPDGKRYIVLEGNRRLAALKVLRSEDLARSLKIDLDPLTAPVRKTLSEISVRVMRSRSDGRAYIGFKHINGPHKWDATAKAQYATDWLDDGGSLEAIAKILGDRNDFVRRLVFGYKTLDQAERNGFSKSRAQSRRFAFRICTLPSRGPAFEAI